MKIPSDPKATRRFLPYVCCGCGRATKMPPMFACGWRTGDQKDYSRIYPSVCLGCCLDDAKYTSIPVAQAGALLVAAAIIVDLLPPRHDPCPGRYPCPGIRRTP